MKVGEDESREERALQEEVDPANGTKESEKVIRPECPRGRDRGISLGPMPSSTLDLAKLKARSYRALSFVGEKNRFSFAWSSRGRFRRGIFPISSMQSAQLLK